MIGNKIRALRAKDKILLRHLAAQLDIDTAMLSKMERGDRFFRREDIVALAQIFRQPEGDLFQLWLADKILKTIEGEEYKEEALKLALKSIK